ncbi:MAG: hypothetical protein RQ760_16515 [Sedimentisphaerales bacterium]|nr:hypothetical protein [Sedimentisphaerales bacterium]
MADETYSTVETYLNTNINTNNTNSITGALHNTAEKKLLNGLAGKLFDTTRPYKAGQLVVKNDTTFGDEIWEAASDVAAGTWNSANFTRLTRRVSKITTSDTPYTGIEAGTNFYTHGIGHTDVVVFAKDSSGGNIPLNVTATSTTKVTITSASNQANAVVYVYEMVIS